MNRIVIGLVAFILGIGLGGIGGFFAGAASTDFGGDLLRSAFITERTADVDNPKTISRKHFGLQYSGNWTEDQQLEYYEPEHYISIDSPGGSYTMLVIYDMASEPGENVDNHVTDYMTSLREVVRTRFSKWGQYTGTGIELKGKNMGYYPSRVRIFSFSSDKKSFTVVEQSYSEDEALTTPGFQLIEQTFKLKNP